MESGLLGATAFNLGVNLLYTLLALVLGVVALIIVDRLLLRRTDIEEELKNGNIAVSIFASTILLFVALIVTFGLNA
ncbi:MAG: DUF350 domain-containing protein [Gammaproteobacteria bacterium]|nr:DUF350 domain-containing protein [Gammaproteobacteria bacterium]